MVNKLKALTVVVVTLAFIGLNVQLSHAFTGHHRSGLFGWPMPRFMKLLDLTDEQKQEIKAILQENQPIIQPLLKEFATERRALRDLLQAETIDEPAIQTQAAKVAASEADLAVERAHIHKAIHSVLTPEQQLRFKELQKKRDRRVDKFISHRAKVLKEE